ncbi:amidase family protein [Arthrobacter sp. CDRTa11]|uniref:amidase family protein n=1 Tax=Arthrobacter sp. CDRTa11 TaxID=2651199 RepID=UPI002265C7E3|nr:amidase family protein [Arthrobacter sp. CDRTa11]
MTMTLAAWLTLDPIARSDAACESRAAAAKSAVSHGTYIFVADESDFDAEVQAGGKASWSGVPIAVKDNIDVAGFPTTGGASFLANSIPQIDAGVVGRMRQLGTVIVGKTNLHELAFGITSNNGAFGPVRNPVNPFLSAGGSSGGSAATVADGTVPLSLGTDTGGSISIPAAFCGVAGFRPSLGRYQGDGVLHLSWTRDTIGTHANTVADLRLADEHISEQPRVPALPLPSELAVGIANYFYQDLDPAVAKVAEQALNALTRSGVRLINVDLPPHFTHAEEVGRTVVGWEAPRSILAYLRGLDAPYCGLTFEDVIAGTSSPDVAKLLQHLRDDPVLPEEYRQAMKARWQLRHAYASVLSEAGVNAMIFPTSPVLPPHLGLDKTLTLNGRDLPIFPTVTRHTAPGTVMGVPMVTLPAGRAEGLPVGMTLEGGFFTDPALLALAETVESVLVS